MEKVLVVNLNLAIDKTVRIPGFRTGRTYRFKKAMTLPGGKGVNVARALKTLGDPCLLMGIAAGHNGGWIMDNLPKSGLESDIVKDDCGESRICYSIVSDNGKSTDLNEDGCHPTEKAQDKFIARFSGNLAASSFISVSGRTPPGLRRGFYSELVRKAARKKIPTVLDIRGKSLLEGIRAGTDYVKINRYEFEEAFRRPFAAGNAEAVFRRHEKEGLKALIITNGPGPGICVTARETYRFVPPDISGRIKTPVGAGDSFLAGFIHSRLSGFDWPETLAFSAACAVSDCLSLGAGIIKPEEIRIFRGKIRFGISGRKNANARKNFRNTCESPRRRKKQPA